MNVAVITAVLLIGFAAGLRTFTAPAVVAWAGYLSCINFGATSLGFMSSPVAGAILSVAALGEYIVDLLPKTPPRTAALGLIGRFVSGSFSAACLLAAAGLSVGFCLVGGLAAIAGAFAGYHARTRIVPALGIKDAFVAISEDVVAIAVAIGAVGIIR